MLDYAIIDILVHAADALSFIIDADICRATPCCHAAAPSLRRGERCCFDADV